MQYKRGVDFTFFFGFSKFHPWGNVVLCGIEYSFRPFFYAVITIIVQDVT